MLERFAQARVLMIDDSLNVASLQEVLTDAGLVHVFTETDPHQVLSRLPEVDPDLIILDLQPAPLDGYAVLARIREFASSDFLPVLVLTEDTTSAASEGALRAGAQDFVIKPCNPAELLLRTQGLLETRFLYTALRSSIVRQADEREAGAFRLNQAIASGQESVDRLEQLDGLKDILLQAVSHDLRNSVSAVLALTGLLADDALGTQPLPLKTRLSVIEKVGSSARTMDRLLKDLLDSDPMRKDSDHLQRCDVGELVQRALVEIDLGRDHPLHTEIVSVMAGVDPVHVERIVENLLTNARQHLAPGVPIWVRTAALADGVLISVDDAGPGVDAELAEVVFEPFRRGSDGPGPGLGLGLSLVSRFAQRHGGRAWVEQRPGGGAAFRVYLPSSSSADPRPTVGR